MKSESIKCAAGASRELELSVTRSMPPKHQCTTLTTRRRRMVRKNDRYVAILAKLNQAERHRPSKRMQMDEVGRFLVENFRKTLRGR